MLGEGLEYFILLFFCILLLISYYLGDNESIATKDRVTRMHKVVRQEPTGSYCLDWQDLKRTPFENETIL